MNLKHNLFARLFLVSAESAGEGGGGEVLANSITASTGQALGGFK